MVPSEEGAARGEYGEGDTDCARDEEGELFAGASAVPVIVIH